jgi:type IV pili sensor histidine kinase/response regulator
MLASLLTAVAVIGGCATEATPVASVPVEEVAAAPGSQLADWIPVVRSGRYTLVELEPTAQQRELLLQVVDVTLPDDARATVGDGLRHVLKRSGYRLCALAPEAADLDALPLPAAHRHLGPITLRAALLTLAGPAWRLAVDESTRQVCFSRADDVPGRSSAVAQTSPLAAEEQP